MFRSDNLLGCPDNLNELIAHQDHLKCKVVEQVNQSQGLMMINTFTHQSNEYKLKQSFEERICEISSWRWVLQDLAKRLSSAVEALMYEHNAVAVIMQRLDDEVNCFSLEATRPGALCPNSDVVEEIVMQEYKFLRNEKQKFADIKSELEKRIAIIEKTVKRIENDVLTKEKTMEIEERCADLVEAGTDFEGYKVKKKKRFAPLEKWHRRCNALKASGIQALSNAVMVRQAVRGSRVKLSISAQAYASRVDAALRRRLHTNTIKLQDLEWQKDEAQKDQRVLEEELASTEQSLHENLTSIRLVEAKLRDRTLRPAGELTRDDVDKMLRAELARLRLFVKGLRDNIERIHDLQRKLTSAIHKMEDASEDISKVVRLDTMRINCRQGDQRTGSPSPTEPETRMTDEPQDHRTSPCLATIREENEEDIDAVDDYPFDF